MLFPTNRQCIEYSIIMHIPSKTPGWVSVTAMHRWFMNCRISLHSTDKTRSAPLPEILEAPHPVLDFHRGASPMAVCCNFGCR